ncbi:MAG: DUF2971 domain-containing protein [Bacteroidota bacterium]|nr:DUF2971 domain-containing protein [Bacteroidota bacterium]
MFGRKWWHPNKTNVSKAFRYRGNVSFDRELNDLKNCQIFVPNKELLNDPCEMLTDDISFIQLLEYIERKKGISIEKIKSEFEIFKDRILKAGIFSLSVSKEPLNLLLWSHYANSHKGFCIEYDLDVLTQYNNEVNTFWVNYSDKIPVFKPKLFLGKDNEVIRHFTGFKSKYWKYENEFRLLYDNSGLQDYEHKAVRSIYFGIRMDDKEKERIFETLQGRSIQYFQMCLLPRKYELYSEKIVDPYYRVKREIVINNHEDVTWFLENAKSDYGIELSDYLRKAINLVSNYPNVQSIKEAIVIFNKDTPIMKVEYQKFGLEFKPPKIYRFTKEDIDNEYENTVEIERKKEKINEQRPSLVSQ